MFMGYLLLMLKARKLKTIFSTQFKWYMRERIQMYFPQYKQAHTVYEAVTVTHNT